MEPTPPSTTTAPEAAAPPAPAPLAVRHGELADLAAILLTQGFTAIRLRLTKPSLHSTPETAWGYAGDPRLEAVFDGVVAIGHKVGDLDKNEGVDVRLENGNRLLFRTQLESGPDGRTISFVGEEVPGPHRKSTPRNIRRLLRKVLKSTRGA